MPQDVPPLAPFSPLGAFRAALGESPIWSPRDDAIWWVDIEGWQVIRTALDGTQAHWATPEVPGFVAEVAGVTYVGLQSGIFHFDPARAVFRKIVSQPLTHHRFNDACTDDQGRIWAGTMDLEMRRDDGVLYLFDPARGTLVQMSAGFRVINGLAWDGARARLYVSDSHPTVQQVWTHAIGPDGLSRARPFADFSPLTGRPDGAALDREGSYWCAGVGGGRLYRFAPDGRMTGSWRVPQDNPTKPVFLPRDGGAPALAMTSKGADAFGGRLGLWADGVETSLAAHVTSAE